MRTEGGRAMRSWRNRAVATLTVLSFLPVAALAASAPAHVTAPTAALHALGPGGGPLHGTTGLDEPTVDALLRGWESDLFASFGWDGTTASGSLVQFSFDPSPGSITSLLAKRGNDSLAVANAIESPQGTSFEPPFVDGPLFVATSSLLVITAHDDPTGLLEFRTTSTPVQVLFRFVQPLSNVSYWSMSASGLRAALGFNIGANVGRMVLGEGSLDVEGANVTANLAANDVLAMKILPSFEEERAPRAAVLDAFGSGDLAAEFALVAEVDGGWVGNSARFRPDLNVDAVSVTMGHANVSLSAPDDRGGFVFLAFDPETMPADSNHRLIVSLNGTPLSTTDEGVSALSYWPSSAAEAFYVRLGMNATVVAVYLPSYRSAVLDVVSLGTGPAGPDWVSELAAVAGLAVVAVAASVMFRRQDT